MAMIRARVVPDTSGPEPVVKGPSVAASRRPRTRPLARRTRSEAWREAATVVRGGGGWGGGGSGGRGAGGAADASLGEDDEIGTLVVVSYCGQGGDRVVTVN